jgi:hypothetical protein
MGNMTSDLSGKSHAKWRRANPHTCARLS